ncbi:MAG TPA: anti-sigma factor [Myxococcota bacterium]|nr:anti-sigma factor [Myxococcota bacterium]
MICEERAEEILGYAADTLDAGEREALARHLATGCPRCAGALAEAECVVAHLALSVAPEEPSPTVRARLFARLEDALPSAPGAPDPAHSAAPRRPGRRWQAGVAAALAAGLVAIVTHFGINRPLVKEIEGLRTAREALTARVAALEGEVAKRDARIAGLEGDAARSTETVRMLRSPEVEVIPLRGGAAQPEAGGRLFFDHAAARWYFHASRLRPAGPGKTYELWFINHAQQKVRAATFDADAGGEATLLVDVSEKPGALALAAVTEEPAGGLEQPSGAIQLVGQPTAP